MHKIVNNDTFSTIYREKITLIEIKDIVKEFEGPEGVHTVLHDVNLTINDGDIFGIIGMSGAGKSTLVRCLNLLETPTSGQIIIDGEDITQYGGRQLRELRRSVSMIFQSFNLFAQKTVLHNVVYPLIISGKRMSEVRERGVELLDKVGLADKADAYPAGLSGGQQQRVAIARALANNPRYILCDEATSALDTLTTNQILKLLRSINEEMGVTLIMITHSMDVVEKVCNKVAVIDNGYVVEKGLTSQVFESPKHHITARLLGRVDWDA